MSLDIAELCSTASRLAATGKGLLASDESIGTLGKRLEKAGIANTEVTGRWSLAALVYKKFLKCIAACFENLKRCSHTGQQAKLPGKLLHSPYWRQYLRRHFVQRGTDSSC